MNTSEFYVYINLLLSSVHIHFSFKTGFLILRSSFAPPSLFVRSFFGALNIAFGYFS